jgi:hypothetical protein
MNMNRMVILLSITAVAIASHVTAALADDDVRTICRADSIDDPSAGTAAGCFVDEQKAHETLSRNPMWA